MSNDKPALTVAPEHFEDRKAVAQHGVDLNSFQNGNSSDSG